MNAITADGRCPDCGRQVVQQGKPDGWVVRTPIVTVSGDGLTVGVICKHCHAQVSLPLVAKPSARPQILVRRK